MKTKLGRISFFSNKPHCNNIYYNGEIRGRRAGLGYTWVATCLNETEKGGETSKSKIQKGEYIGMANMQWRKDRDGLVMMGR